MALIALYMRVSEEDEQAKEDRCSASIEGQRLALQEFVRRLRSEGKLHGYELDGVREFVDDGFSGMNMQRPGLRLLLSACAAKEVDCIVVNELSRLARSYIDLGDLVECIFPTSGVRFISRAEGIDLAAEVVGGCAVGLKRDEPGDCDGDSSAGVTSEELSMRPGVRSGMGFVTEDVDAQFVRAAISICNNAYSLQISRNVRGSMAASWKRGEHVQANVPFGYVFDRGARGHMRPDPVAGAYVRDIFGMAAEGMTSSEIAAWLNERGVPTPAEYARIVGNGKARCYGEELTPWNARKVRGVLRREAYAGVLVGGSTRMLGVGRGSPKRVTAECERVRVENAHEPLVSREVWDLAQMVIGRGARTMQVV